MNAAEATTASLYNSQMITMRGGQVGDMGARSSYLDTIKEESEARRTRFYKQNMAMIYAQSGVQNPTGVEN